MASKKHDHLENSVNPPSIPVAGGLVSLGTQTQVIGESQNLKLIRSNKEGVRGVFPLLLVPVPACCCCCIIICNLYYM